MGVDDLRPALEVLNLAVLDELSSAVRQALDDVVLEFAQLREIDLRLAELDAPRLRMPRLVDELGDVQERLRRNTPAVDADAAGVRLGIDQRGRNTQVGREKRGGVASRASANDDELSGDQGISRSTRSRTAPLRLRRPTEGTGSRRRHRSRDGRRRARAGGAGVERTLPVPRRLCRATSAGSTLARFQGSPLPARSRSA